MTDDLVSPEEAALREVSQKDWEGMALHVSMLAFIGIILSPILAFIHLHSCKGVRKGGDTIG